MKKKSRRKVTFRKAKSLRENKRGGNVKVSVNQQPLPDMQDDIRRRMVPITRIAVSIMQIYKTSIPGNKVRLIQYTGGKDPRFAGYFF